MLHRVVHLFRKGIMPDQSTLLNLRVNALYVSLHSD